MASKGKLKVKVATAKIKPYKVSGATLEEVWEDIRKKGPKDGGSDRAGYTKAPIVTPSQVNFDGETTPKEKDAKEYEAKVWYKGGEISVTPEITLPELTSEKDLSDEDLKTWKAYLKDVRAHEDEHVEATRKEAEAICDELNALEGEGKGKDKKEAIKKAQEDFEKKLKKDFDAKTVEKRAEKVNKALDTGGHGPVLKFTKKKS